MTVKKPYALVCSFDDAFVDGAELLMASFLRYNPWFKGDWIVVSEQLSAASQARLRKVHPFILKRVSAELKAKVASVLAIDPRLTKMAHSIYKLDLFSYKGYQRLVFLDVDMLCVGDISALFKGAPDFGAAPDDLTLDPWFPELRSRFSKGVSQNLWRYGKELKSAFNAGMFTVSAKVLGQRAFEGMMADPFFSDPLKVARSEGTVDQYVMNRYFGDRAVDVGCIYNWSIYMDDLLRHAYRKLPHEARIIHYAGSRKPWTIPFKDLAKHVLWQELPYYMAWHHLHQELLAGGAEHQASLDAYRDKGRRLARHKPLLKRWQTRWERWQRGRKLMKESG